MEFRILGPLEVRRDGTRVEIPGRHRPKLLAALILDAGRVVTIPRLVEVLWGVHPPDTARRQVQNTMAALRRDLTAGDVPAIESTSEGYRVPKGGNAIDAHAFADLVTRARGARHRDAPADSLRLLREALDLWRGDACAGMSSDIIQAAAGRLDEARLSAIEERTELELTLPDHAPDIGELRELAERHPFRQRLAGQLMTALHRSGRTPEALEVYELLQRRLDQDLGLDPEARLAELRTEILRDNAKNDAPTPQAPPRAAPEQLPADPTALVGRDDQLSTLDQLLYNGRTTAVVSAIDGAGGVGKTALAVHWAHQVRQHFPEGQLYLDLRGYDAAEPVTPADALATLLHALGQPDSTIPANLDDAAAMYRSLLADRHMLVLLDNAREAAQVRPLLPGGTGNFALVTSRDSLASLIALDDAVPVRVDTLGPNESIALIADVVGASRVEAAGDAAARLAEVCGHLPLALRIAAAHLAAHPNAPLSTMAADIARRANERDAVAAVCDIAVAALGPADRALLAALTAVPDEDFAAEATLGRLIAAHLVEHHRPGRCRLHDLVRGAVTRRAAVLRHCGQTAGTGLSDR